MRFHLVKTNRSCFGESTSSTEIRKYNEDVGKSDGTKSMKQSRIVTEDLGSGRHELFFRRVEMTDGPTIVVTTPSNRGYGNDDERGYLTSKCKLNIIKGEAGPVMTDILLEKGVIGWLDVRQ